MRRPRLECGKVASVRSGFRERGRVRSSVLMASAALASGGLMALGVSTASAAGPGFSAHGSAEQVYVTGLPTSARASLITPRGRTLSTQPADGLGGLL